MCRICDKITSVRAYWPQTLDFKSIDFGILGKDRLYLGIDCDVETEKFQITAEFDTPRSDSYTCVTAEIKYCPFCGKELVIQKEDWL